MLYGYYEHTGRPFRGRTLEEVKSFLQRMELTYDEGIEYTVAIRNEEDDIVACASLQGNVIKCVAVDPAMQGEGLTATLLTTLQQEAMTKGERHLFLYTKPENATQFGGLGFYEIARTDSVLLMENRRGGFSAWVERVRDARAQGTIGAVVMNCNPMTLGHRYLIETAASQCDFLYLFIVSEDRSAVPAADRRAIVEAATADLAHVRVVGTERYLISSATFPDYFLKDRNRSGDVWTKLDIAVFSQTAKLLGITKRFVGSEPFCPVTGAYNDAMRAALPAEGIALVELARMEQDGTAVSATAVRTLLQQGDLHALHRIVPDATWQYLSNENNRRIVLERMAHLSSLP